MIASITNSASTSVRGPVRAWRMRRHVALPDARTRTAIAATALFAACGAGSAVTRVHDWRIAAPLVAAYVVLVVNTFFSVRRFAPLAARGGRTQRGLDALL